MQAAFEGALHAGLGGLCRAMMVRLRGKLEHFKRASYELPSEDAYVAARDDSFVKHLLPEVEARANHAH